MQIKSFLYKTNLISRNPMRLFKISFFHGRRKLNVHIERVIQIGSAVYQKVSAKPVEYIFKGGDEVWRC